MTITFENGSTPVLYDARLEGPDGTVIPAQVQHPENDSWLSDTWALYSYDPLAKGSTYTVFFNGRAGGQAVNEQWSFTTEN